VRQFLIDQKHVPDARITGARGSGTSFSTGDRHDNSPNWRGVEVIVTASPVPHRHPPPPPPPPHPVGEQPWHPPLQQIRFTLRFNHAIIGAWISEGWNGSTGSMVTTASAPGRVTPSWVAFRTSCRGSGFSDSETAKLYDFYSRWMAPADESGIAAHVNALMDEERRYQRLLDRHEYSRNTPWTPSAFLPSGRPDPGSNVLESSQQLGGRTQSR
jgi:hypothetical protein